MGIMTCTKCNSEGITIVTLEDGNVAAKECTCGKRKLYKQGLRLCKSGIKPEQYKKYSLENFKTDDENSLKMKQLASEFLANSKATGIGFFGKSGVGKTHICVAICLELTIKHNRSHTYFAYRSEIQKLTAAYYRNQTEYERLMKIYKECDNLYIDDLWKNSMNKNKEIDTLEKRITYDLINARYLNNVTTIFSSEFTVAELTNIDSAIGGRIYEMINPYGMLCLGINKRFKKINIYKL